MNNENQNGHGDISYLGSLWKRYQNLRIDTQCIKMRDKIKIGQIVLHDYTGFHGIVGGQRSMSHFVFKLNEFVCRWLKT